jgi:hypothetical protein
MFHRGTVRPELEQERSEPEPPDLDPQESPPAKPPWSAPPQPEFILETPSRRCTWHLVDPRADRRTKPLNFAAMLREDEGEGALVTDSSASPTGGRPTCCRSRLFINPSGGPDELYKYLKTLSRMELMWRVLSGRIGTS